MENLKWSLSKDDLSSISSIVSNLQKKENTLNNVSEEEYNLIRNYWESELKPTSSNTKSPDEIFNVNFFEPKLEGVWKQSFYTQETYDDDSSEDDSDHPANDCNKNKG